MDLFNLTSLIVVLAALFGYINVRFLRLPNAIGLMLITIVATLGLMAGAWFEPVLLENAQAVVTAIDFEHVLLDILLGFLLFAGALHTNFAQLHTYRWPVLVLSTVGVCLSTVITATLMYGVLSALQLPVPFVECLLFGALISPTDPIAVMGILRKAAVPKSLETKIVGESLFNDGIGVVLFLSILNVVNLSAGGPAGSGAHAEADHGTGSSNWLSVLELLGTEVLGGLGLGLALGFVTYWMIKSIDDYEIEVIITLSCVMGGSALAHYLHVSAPLAMVVAGLFIGNDRVRGSAMSERTEEYIDKFWELTDVLLNVVLFVLIGLEILVISLEPPYLFAAACGIPIVILARFLSLIVPIGLFKRRLDFAPHTLTIMTWGGLRGGISIALALGLPTHTQRELLLTITYGIVVFSIVIQGLTIGLLAQRLLSPRSAAGVSDASSKVGP